jgi:DNA helicase HerA-like ATPase
MHRIKNQCDNNQMTGVGKSVLLENMIINDVEKGRGAIVIDPHGELIDTILEKISAKREDVFVLDPSDMAYPFGMNLLELSSQDPLRRELEKVLVVDAYITVMKRIFGEASIGANTDDLFR